MRKPDYNKNSLAHALRKAGLNKGDTVFIHASLGRLGIPEEGLASEIMCRVLDEALREAVGEAGTILIPTYTYSIGRKEVYDPDRTPSTIGPFTEYFRQKPGAERTLEPMLAVSGIGPATKFLFSALPPTSYGKGSLYDRLVQTRSKICCVGVGLHYATFRHHIEEMAAVPFRFLKMFTGTIRQNEQETTVHWGYYAAPFVDNCKPDGHRLQAMMEEQGIATKVYVGRASVTCIGAAEYFKATIEAFSKEPWLAAKGPPCKIEKFE